MSIEHILAPVDFSVPSGHAFQAAARLAETFDAKLTLLHALDEPDDRGTVEASLKTFLDTWAQPGTHCETELVDGPSAQAIAERAALGIDLLVCGTHGRTGLERVVLGSFAEKLVRLVPCPVWVVRPGEWTTHPRRILHPTDFSKASAAALQWAVYLASGFGASLHLTHVLSRPSYHLGEDEALEREYEKARVQALEAMGKLGDDRLSISTSVHVGFPAKKIVELATDEEFDLIVCGTHGRTGKEHELLGSVAERVVRVAPCAVLTVRHGSKA